MKGITKALQRTPHNFTTRIGLAKKSQDPEYNDYERKFAAIEAASEKMLKDSAVFRDSVTSLLMSGQSFARSFTTLFSPLGNEYNLAAKHPQAELTVKNIGMYEQLMEEMRETLQPELELIDTRIVQPCKELTDICKKIRKTCTKRDHKLVDYDRHNNSLNKLREKKEKSLSDEKNLFKVEQDFELASGEYEHYNNLLKTELPMFLAMAVRFIDPLFHSFYYMQLNVYYIMLQKLQSFAGGKYDLERKDIENIYYEQRGDAAEQIEELQITKRIASTAKFLASARAASGTAAPAVAPSRRTPSMSSAPTLGRKDSLAVKQAEAAYTSPQRTLAAPPPYTSANSSASITKKGPPPPPPLKAKPSFNQAQYCTAIFDFEAQAEGDLSFSAGDRIEIMERSDNVDDWWTGRLNGRVGIFPGTYTQVD